MAWLARFLLVGALVAPGAALAKGTCIHTTALGGWTFVIQKASLKPGASGEVAGYAAADDGVTFEPIAGGFITTAGGFLQAGITRYHTLYNGGTNVDPSTTFHQLAVPLDGEVGPDDDLSWTREGNGTITGASGDAKLVDCAGVPAIPVHPI